MTAHRRQDIHNIPHWNICQQTHLHSVATAFARRVLPVPGGPNKRTPDLLFMPAQNITQYLQNPKIKPRMEKFHSNLKKIVLGVEAEAVQYPRYLF
jgi:hypothetical protein